jgi:RNA polymerase sigma factor (sigma-70 family)
MNSFLESPDFKNALQRACKSAYDQQGWGQKTYQSGRELWSPVMQRLHYRTSRNEEIKNLEGYLYRIATNLIKDARRAEASRPDLSNNSRRELQDDLDQTGSNNSAGRSDKIFASILVRECLAKLSPEERLLFLDYWVNGNSLRDIADRRDVTAPTVASEISRIMVKLRKLCESR